MRLADWQPGTRGTAYMWGEYSHMIFPGCVAHILPFFFLPPHKILLLVFTWLMDGHCRQVEYNFLWTAGLQSIFSFLRIFIPDYLTCV